MKFIILCTYFLCSSFAFAASQKDCKIASKSLEKYIALDSKGETLHTSKDVDQLVYYNGRDTAGFDSYTVITESKIQSCKPKDAGLEIVVLYKVLGNVSGPTDKKNLDTVLSSKPSEKTESFYMLKDSNTWKIDSPSVHEPHISAATAKKLVK